MNLLGYFSICSTPLSSEVLQCFVSVFSWKRIAFAHCIRAVVWREQPYCWVEELQNGLPTVRWRQLPCQKNPGDSVHETLTRTKWARNSNDEICWAVFQPTIAPLMHTLDWKTELSHPTPKVLGVDLPGTQTTRHLFSIYLCSLSILYPSPHSREWGNLGEKHYPERKTLLTLAKDCIPWWWS